MEVGQYLRPLSNWSRIAPLQSGVDISPDSCCFYCPWEYEGLQPTASDYGYEGSWPVHTGRMSYIYFISCMFEFRIKMRSLEHKMLAVFIEIDIMNAGIMRAVLLLMAWTDSFPAQPTFNHHPHG